MIIQKQKTNELYNSISSNSRSIGGASALGGNIFGNSPKRQEKIRQMEIIEMKQGLVYYISYGGTSIVGRYINSDACNLYFNAYLHNWAGYESFHGGKNTYCVKAGVEEIRRASHPEIQSLIRQEIEHGTI